MATVTAAVSAASTTNVSPWATAAFTPAAGDILVVFAIVSGTSPSSAFNGCSSSNGWTFTRVTSYALSTTHLLVVYITTQRVTATSGTISISQTAGTVSGCAISVLRIAGMFGVPTVDAGTVPQIVVASVSSGATPAATFPALTGTNNVLLGFVGNQRSPATLTPPSGWTEAHDVGYATPTTGLEVCYLASGGVLTTVTWSSTSSTIGGVIIVELETASLVPPRKSPRVARQAVKRSSVF